MTPLNPRRSADAPVVSIPTASTTPRPAAGHDLLDAAQEVQVRRRRVLIVDDEAMNQRFLAAALSVDYEVQTARSGAGALRAIAESGPPDLILLDVTMPDISGLQLCRILKSREETRQVPVIFVTGRSQVSEEAEGFAVGAVDYISKPVAIPILRARVHTHIELRRRAELLDLLTSTDALTGIPNRRRLDDILEREWRRCMRSGMPLAVAMVDVDHFKQFNDHYGHGPGDDCLRQVARAIAGAALRSSDLAGRYGGEEFTVILPETDGDGGMTVAERLRSAVEALQLPHAESSVSSVVTVSAGVAATVPSPAPPRAGARALLEAADRALYAAKRTGRNRIALADVHDRPEPCPA